MCVKVLTPDSPRPPFLLPETKQDEPFMTYEPHPSAVGWDKDHWRQRDWVSWLVTGPTLSVLFTAFVISTFGWLPGTGVALVCLGVDLATYYWNW